jgi:riboflavin synthase
MFSGIIRELGEVVSIEKQELSAVIEIRSKLFSECQIGDSVSISGVCLTVTKLSSDTADFDVSSETLRKTSLQTAEIGKKVNLETPLTLSTLLHGHIVQGHVDGVGEIQEMQQEGETYRVSVGLDKSLMKYLVPKGSVTIDGVSLTVGEIQDSQFSLYIIPKTWEWTTFQFYKVGTLVNVEVDILAKYVERLFYR